MIEINNVSVSYPNGVQALSKVNLCVADGEFVFIVGPTGAGKSTLLKLLYREERATEGRVVVAGQELNRISQRDLPFFRRKLGIVFQDYGLLPNKTVYENIAFALRVTGANRIRIRKQVQETLEMVGMLHRPDAFPHQISGGEQQRVAIARALINSPPLLIADEPTGNLDTRTSHEIMETLVALNREQGLTILVVTHESDIAAYADRILTMRDGLIVADQRVAHQPAP